MKTSAIRNPKFDHCLSIRAWQMQATGKNIHAALLLSYLEEKFNLMLHMENKKGGWMTLNRFQLRNGIFTENFDNVQYALDLLDVLGFIELKELDEGKSFEIKLKADVINNWIDVYGKAGETRVDLLDFNPFLYLLMFALAEVEVERQPTIREIVREIVEEIGSPSVKEVIVEKVVKTQAPINAPLEQMQIASQIFEFWKWVTDHPRSKISDKLMRMIIARMKDGYTEYDLAHAVMGMIARRADPDFAKYDTIDYIVKEGARVDRFVTDAESIGYTLDKSTSEYIDFCDAFEKHREAQTRMPARPIDDLNKNKVTGKPMV